MPRGKGAGRPPRRANLAVGNDSDEPSAKKAFRVAFEMSVPKRSQLIGNVLVCGQGDMGQLGLGEDEMERKRPAHVVALKDIVDVQAGGMHNLCLTSGGELYSFGCNDEGALGRDTTEEGSEFVPKLVQLPGKPVRISAGDSHSACLLEDGRVFAWGSFRDSHGNMGLTLEGNKRLPVEVVVGSAACDIASGADHLVVLTCLGFVFTFGCAEQGQLGRVSIRCASGESRRGKTPLLIPGNVLVKPGKKMEAIWATTYCTFMREAQSQQIWAFGLNNYLQLGRKISKQGDQLVSHPIDTKFENVKKIAGGQHHTLVLTNDNQCYTIGRHDYGRLGLGDAVKEDIEELRLVSPPKGLRDVACGEAQSFAITLDGKVYAWGMGSNLQLGTGSEDDVNVPVLVKSKQTEDKNILQVSSGGQHTIFLVAADGTPAAAAQSPTVEATPAAAAAAAAKPVVEENGSESSAVEDNNDKGTVAAPAKKGRKKK